MTNEVTPRGGLAVQGTTWYVCAVFSHIVRQKKYRERTGINGTRLVSALSVHEELWLPASTRNILHADEHEVVQAKTTIAYGPHSVAICGAFGAWPFSVLYNTRKPPLKKDGVVLNEGGRT